MSIYTKRGDRGITDMAHAGNISKSDDRIRLMGEADELNSHIELVKSMLRQSEILQLLERIQKNLDLIAAGVSNPYDRTVKSVKRKQQCWRRKQINWKHCAKSLFRRSLQERADWLQR